MAGIRRAWAVPRCLLRLLAPASTRSFGGVVAALPVEYESDGDLGRHRWPAGAADTCGDEEGRGVQWAFVGRAGSRKRVLAARMAALLGVPHISMGGLVRRELHPRSALYKQIASAVDEGKVISEEVIVGVLWQRLEEGRRRGETGFILDGIPRTRAQARIMDQITDIDLVINFQCMQECLLKQHLESSIRSHCGGSVSTESSESATSNSCSATTIEHSQLKPPAAKDVETHGPTFQTYAKESKLLEDYYRKQRKLLDFQVFGSLGETWRALLAALHLQHRDAVSSSRAS